MKVIKYLLAALLVITITKKAHPNESLVPQTAGHLDTFHDEDEQSIQQDFTPDITQQTPSLHDSISQIPKTTLQSTLPNYKGSYPPTIINMKPLEEKLSDDNPGPLFASETSPIDQEEQENLQPIPTKDKDLITKGMPVSQIVATTLDHIIPDHQTLSDHVIHHIDNALHQESMNEPEESIMPEEPEPIINDLTDQPEEDNFKQEEKPISTEMAHENLMPSMPLRQVIATKVNSILSEATEESVSNILHPTLVDQALTHAIHNPEQENDLQPTDDETYEEKTDQMPGMPVRHIIANKVNSILSEATEESVSNILHPDLVEHALNNLDSKNQEPEETIEPASQKNYAAYTTPEDMANIPSQYDLINNQPQNIVSHYIPHPIDPDYSKVMKLGTMGDSDTSAIHENQPEPTTLQTQEEDAPIFVDLASLKLKQGPQPSKNLEYYDPVSKMAQIKNGPLFVGIIEHNKITETPPGSEIRSLKKIPATIPTPDYDQLQHGFYGGISPRTALYGLCVERCNPYSSTVELSYPIKSIQNSNKTIGHYWPDSKIVQYKTGETFVEVVLQKRYHYRTIEKPTLSQIKTWFDQKKLLKQYGISSHDDHFDDLINPDGIGTVEIEKRHKQTLYGVQLINPYRPESKTSSELLQHKKSMTRIVHDTLTPGLDEARAKTKLRIEHALNTLSLKNQS